MKIDLNIATQGAGIEDLNIRSATCAIGLGSWLVYDGLSNVINYTNHGEK